MGADVTVLVGTTKGVFLLVEGAGEGGGHAVQGPHCGGWPINHVIGDPATGMLWAAGGSDWHGAGVWRSSDGGQTWTLSKLANGQFDAWLRSEPQMAKHWGIPLPEDAPHTGAVQAMWSLHRAGGVLYAGGKPASLWASHDDGATWVAVPGLTDHPSRPDWEPGAAGLILHSMLSDPDDPRKLWVGISAAGVFATEDGGQTWERRNRLDNAAYDHGPLHDHDHSHGTAAGHEIGFCVHNMARAPGGAQGSDLLYQQNHHGVFRSADGGRNWHDVTAGLPSTFGFPIAVHPHDPATLWVLPLNGDTQGRYPPEAKARVWRSRDGGETWEALADGLPARDCYFTVLRQAMATDRRATAGVYFGTNSGSVFASRDEGDHWDEIARHLPTVLSVETLERAAMGGAA